LRGRIGRGAHASLCLLASWVAPDSRAGRRLNAVAGTLDGFALADLDLRERREGDVLGRSQSGRAITLQLLSLIDHQHVIEAARDFCEQVYDDESAHPGLGLLAAPFIGTERIAYLDKS
jgi:ATP-dependent DNA helicase RecG